MSQPDMRGDATGPIDYDGAAQAAIRAYCGWHIAPILTETLYVSARHTSPKIFIPSGHVVDIERLEMLENNKGTWKEVAGYGWDETGTLELTGGQRFTKGLRNVRVTLTHGYQPDEVPDVLAIADAIARRAAMSLYGVASQSVNGATVAYQTAGGAPLSVPLLNIEKDALAKYVISSGRIPG